MSKYKADGGMRRVMFVRCQGCGVEVNTGKGVAGLAALEAEKVGFMVVKGRWFCWDCWSPAMKARAAEVEAKAQMGM